MDELAEAVSQAVARVVAHDALRVTASNPAGGVGSFSFAHRYEPDIIQAVLQSDYVTGGPCSWPDLARRPVPAGVVGAGDGRRDRVMRRLFSAHGVGCELRLLLSDTRGIWGSFGLLRAQGSATFDEEDVRRAACLGPVLKAVLRRYVTAGPLTPVIPAFPTGVLIVGPDYKIRATTPQARTWLKQVQDTTCAPNRIGRTFMAILATQAREHARDPRIYPPVTLAPATCHGRWVACQAQPLDDGTENVAITIQAAAGGLLLPSFCDWYGITTRERQALEHLCTGAATKQIARRLGISEHTVNDHLKAVMRKTGASGRDELLAAITS